MSLEALELERYSHIFQSVLVLRYKLICLKPQKSKDKMWGNDINFGTVRLEVTELQYKHNRWYANIF